MTDVKKQKIEDYTQGVPVNWKKKFFKTVPYMDASGNELQQDPPLSNKEDIIGEQKSITNDIQRYVKKNKHKNQISI